MQDSKPRDWADRGTDTGGTPRANIKNSHPADSKPATTTEKPGIHVPGTAGRKGYPKLSK
jgi:hypothetical protein